MQDYHVPVMTEEVASYLINNPDGCYADCTLGGGGHSVLLLSRFPGIRIVGVDRDAEALSKAKETLSQYSQRIQFVKSNFSELDSALAGLGIKAIDGVLMDLGVSSHQLDADYRGFGFKSQTLDMRMDASENFTAGDLINNLDEASLADIIYKYGEERASRKIAKRIVQEREKGTVITPAILSSLTAGAKGYHGKTNPATLVFQALRIATNKELDSLTSALTKLPSLLNPGARIVIMSYHSLEDRIAKQNFRKMDSEDVYKILTKKVVTASEQEISVNPRSRSAKLRAAEKI